jgi:hypothetical protein
LEIRQEAATPCNKEVATMTVTPRSTEVKKIVYRTLLEYEVDETALADLEENMLIDDGRYVARSYRTGGFLAMWLIDVGLLQFYDERGNMLRTVNLFEELKPRRMAA